MPYFYINRNRQPSGDFEVHQDRVCPHPAALENRIALGNFLSCHDAVRKAKTDYPNDAKDINGCFYCAKSCHTT